MKSLSISQDCIDLWRADTAYMQEKELRQYAARRAQKLGYGGISLVSNALGIDRRTIQKGIDDLENGNLYVSGGRIRKDGGGRNTVAKNFAKHIAEWNQHHDEKHSTDYLKTLEYYMTDYAYGDPSARGIFTRATPELLVKLFQEDYGFKTSASSIRRSLDELGYSLQRNQKLEQVGEQHPKRNAQFEYRKELMAMALKSNTPLLSQDTKAKIKVGLYASNGREWRRIRNPRALPDHDFGFKVRQVCCSEWLEKFSDDVLNKMAVAVPNGVYCLNNNTAFVSVGIDHDTAEFAGNTILGWHERLGKEQFPDAKSLVILCDGGGSNRANGYTWKLEVAKVAIALGMDFIQIFHHPPGTSKWDPIEHRLWSLVSIHWMGQQLDSFETIRGYIQSTTSKTGLRVLCELDTKQYLTEKMKREAAKVDTTVDLKELTAKNQFDKIARIEYLHEDEDLRKWNYIIRPIR